jgi:hypothetical protein
MEKDLRERVIQKAFSGPLDSNTEYRYANACDAVTQFLISGPFVQEGFARLFPYYDSLEYQTKLSFLQALNGAYPALYGKEIGEILNKESDPILFSICCSYLFNIDSSINNGNNLKIRMVEKFPGYDTIPVLQALQEFLSKDTAAINEVPPDLVSLFNFQKNKGFRNIYSFQRHNRDYPGLAIIQKEDGSFVRNADGTLAVYEQLARSGSNLPYFIKDGNTPQGIYSIQEVSVSHNRFIGPTPNLHLILPFEKTWEKFFHMPHPTDSLNLYFAILPESWCDYRAILEAWNAGKSGRTAIIVHGTTLDPQYYRNKSFYPLVPSEGCLTTKEIWNNTTGRLLVSEELNLVNAFVTTPGQNGFLFVIDLGNQQKPVGKTEIESLVSRSEKQ